MNTRRTNHFLIMAACVVLAAAGAERLPADSLTLLWSQTYSGQGRADAAGVAVDDAAVYATGSTSPAPGSPGDLILLKYDLAGNPVWSRIWPDLGSLGYDGGRQVAIASTGVFVAGSTDEYATWLRDAVTLKYSSDGVLDTSNSPQGWWTKFSGDTSYHGYNYAGDLTVDEAGNMYVVGTSERAYNNLWTYVQKYNAAGSLQWHQNYGAFGQGGNGSNSIVRRGDSLYTAGHSGRGVDEQILSLKYTLAGARLWDTSWGGADSERGLALDVLGDDLFITGYLGTELVVLKLHDNGFSVSYVTSTTFSGPGNDVGNGIQVANHTVYVADSTTIGSQTDALVVAYDTDLNFLWSYSWGGHRQR